MATLAQIGLATGGKAGVKLAQKLAMYTSPVTMIRLVRQLDTPGTPGQMKQVTFGAFDLARISRPFLSRPGGKSHKF